MRSVYLFFKIANWQDIRAVLSEISQETDEKWLFPKGTQHLVVGRLEQTANFEPEDLMAVSRKLGNVPTVVLFVDVSGRIDGREEVLSFASLLLSHFDGVAQDDHSNYCWTASKLAEMNRVEMRSFFREVETNSDA